MISNFLKLRSLSKPLPEAKKTERKQVLNKYINAENDLIFELLKRKKHLDLIKDSLIPNTYVLLENYQVLERLVSFYETREFLILSDFMDRLPNNLREHLEKNMKTNFNWQNGITLESDTIKNHLGVVHSYSNERELDALYEQMDPDNPQESLEILNQINKLKQKMKTNKRRDK